MRTTYKARRHQSQVRKQYPPVYCFSASSCRTAALGRNTPVGGAPVVRCPERLDRWETGRRAGPEFAFGDSVSERVRVGRPSSRPDLTVAQSVSAMLFDCDESGAAAHHGGCARRDAMTSDPGFVAPAQPRNEKPRAGGGRRGGESSVDVTRSFVMRLKDCEAVNRGETKRPPSRPD